MNDQTSVIAAKPLRKQRRQRIWVSPAGAIVDNVTPPAPTKTLVNWEAYVVDTTTNQAVEGYPRLKGSNALNLEDSKSFIEIQKLYLARCTTEPDVDFDALNNNIDSGAWCISMHIPIKQSL